MGGDKKSVTAHIVSASFVKCGIVRGYYLFPYLSFVAGKLFITVSGNAGVSSDTSFPRCHRRQMRQRIYGGGYHGYFETHASRVFQQEVI